MPTLLRKGPYRIFVYAADRREPMHVHVEHDAKVAKFWLDPVRLESSGGMSRREVRRVEKLVRLHGEELGEAWHAYFDG